MESTKTTKLITCLFFFVSSLLLTTYPNEISAKTINLKFAGLLPPQAMFSVTVDKWAEKVNKRTNGRVKVTTYHGQSLGKFMDFPDMVRGGICDMAWVMPIVRGFQILGAGDQPYLVPNTSAAMEVVHALYRQGLFSSMFEEKGFKPLIFMTTDPFYLFFRDKKVTQLSQIKNLKLRGATPSQLQMMKALGASVVSIKTPDLYMALDRKTIDGLITASEYVLIAKLHEVLKYCLWDPISVSASVVFMNLKVWNNLPPDIQVIIQDINQEMRYEFMKMQKNRMQYRDLLVKRGIEVYEIGQQERANFEKALQPVTQAWIGKIEKNNQPGKKLAEEVKRIVNQIKY